MADTEDEKERNDNLEIKCRGGARLPILHRDENRDGAERDAPRPGGKQQAGHHLVVESGRRALSGGIALSVGAGVRYRSAESGAGNRLVRHDVSLSRLHIVAPGVAQPAQYK